VIVVLHQETNSPAIYNWVDKLL